MTKERPWIVTIISFYLLLVSIFSVVTQLLMLQNKSTFQIIFGFIHAILNAVCGVLLLKRISWSRYLFIGTFVISSIISISMYGLRANFIGLCFAIVIIFFLFSGSAGRYFKDPEQLSLWTKPLFQMTIGLFFIIFVSVELLRTQVGLSAFGHDGAISRAFNDVGLPWSFSSFIGRSSALVLIVIGCIMVFKAIKGIISIKKLNQ